MTETFYDVLGVDEDASQGEITDAYRQKVKEYHPDVSDKDDADDVFKRVVQAEEVLGDEEERDRYDSLGHEAYMRRVEGANAASNEQSPWTTGDRREQSHDVGFGGVGAGAGAAGGGGGGSAAGTASRSSRAGTATAGGVGDAESSMGFGRAASRQSSAGWSDDTDSYNRWGDDSYAEGGIGEDDATYAVHDWDEEDAGPDTVTFQMNQQFIVFAVALFFLYPMTAYLTLSPTFHPVVNLVGALFALLMIGFSLTVPKLSLISFGAWSVVGPFLALTVVEWGPWVELLALLFCWVPFGYAAVVAYFTRPS